MTTSCRSLWRNCALTVDQEILTVDELEDRIAPIAAGATQTRELIASLELCHHKAERWIYNIVETIGSGETAKGLGTRSPGEPHCAERVWQNACAALAAWCAGCPSAKLGVTIDSVPASRLIASLGERSPLKEWQVSRVIEKIRSAIHWPQSCDDPSAQYVWLLLSASEYESGYCTRCPEYYKEHEDFWLTTARTIIHDTEGGDAAELSLSLAIDMLWPCHWSFVENLQIVLAAIGGDLYPQKPFAACGRNINMLPNRHRMETICETLKVFCGATESSPRIDEELLALLGVPTEIKKWLAASLDKTIRLQLNPPSDLRVMSALSGPDWIKQKKT